MSKYIYLQKLHSTKYSIKLLILLICIFSKLLADGRWEVSTVAGSGESGFLDGPDATAKFDNPCGITSDSLKNLYVTDCEHVRKLSLNKEGRWEVATIAAMPKQLTNSVITIGDDLYVVDANHDQIYKLVYDKGDWVVSAIAGGKGRGFIDGVGEKAKFNNPTSITNIGNDLYITDTGNCRIRKISFNYPTVAAGVVVESVDDTITYTNKISLKEGSVYEGRLGAANIDACRTPIFGLAYQARYGEVEINEITGEFLYVPNNSNFRGADSFGYFVTDNIIKSKPTQNPKHKQIFVSVQPITGCEAFKKAARQPLWGFLHYLNSIRLWRS
jgi:hypothetical protein